MLNSKIKSLLYADAFWFFGEGMLGPLFAIFAGRIGGDILEITWAWATYLIVAGILIMFIGHLSDRVNKHKLVFYGYIFNAIFTFSYLLVNSPIHLFIVQIGLGISAAMATPTWNALYAQYGNKSQHGLEWGLADGTSQLFTGLSIIIGGLIVVNLSFNILFIVMGLIQMIAVILLIPILKE